MIVINKILPPVKKAALWMLRGLRTICSTMFSILVVIVIIALCIVAVIVTSAEKLFALISSLLASLLAKVGKHLLGAK